MEYINSLDLWLHVIISINIALVVSRLKRKKGLMLVNTITAFLGLSFLLPIVKDIFVLQSIVLSITRITCVYSYALLALLAT